MNDEDALQDLQTRKRQLESHILRSSEYLFKADQDLKRQVAVLYLAIALLLLFEGFFAIREASHMPLSVMLLITVTSVLAIVNCLLLIRTKTYLHRLNEAWLKPEEKHAMNQLRNQHAEIELRSKQPSAPTH